MQGSLGKVVVTTPGQPVRATINLPDPAEPLYVHAYATQRLKTNVGNVYISLSPTDDRIPLRYILAILDQSQPSFSAGITVELNGTNMAEVYIDADNAGDGVIIPVLVA
jgi:hypothetical protein